jgi:hypothetical protein
MYEKYSPFVDRILTDYRGTKFRNKHKLQVGQKVLFFIDDLEEFFVETINLKSFRITKIIKVDKKLGKKTTNAVSFKLTNKDIGRQCFLSIGDFKMAIRENIKKEIEQKESEIKELQKLLEETYE